MTTRWSWLEQVERPTELIVKLDLRDVVANGRHTVGEIHDRDPQASPVTVLASARPNDEPIGPAVEPRRIAQRRHITPDGHERLLDRVLGRVPVAQDAARDEEQSRRRCACELLVRVAISSLCPLDQSGVHAAVPCVLALRGRSPYTWHVDRRSFIRGGVRTGPPSLRVAAACRSRPPRGPGRGPRRSRPTRGPSARPARSPGGRPRADPMSSAR